jgi:hypothetical protein
MDIYVGAEWTEMDIDYVKAAVAAGRSMRKRRSFFAAPTASRTCGRNVGSWG